MYIKVAFKWGNPMGLNIVVGLPHGVKYFEWIVPKCCEGFLGGTMKKLFIFGAALIWHSCSMTGIRFWNGPIACRIFHLHLLGSEFKDGRKKERKKEPTI